MSEFPVLPTIVPSMICSPVLLVFSPKIFRDPGFLDLSVGLVHFASRLQVKICLQRVDDLYNLFDFSEKEYSRLDQVAEGYRPYPQRRE